MSGKCSNDFRLAIVEDHIDFKLERDKFERNHENNSTSLSSVTFLDVLIILIKFSVR